MAHDQIKQSITNLVGQLMPLERQADGYFELGDPKKAKCGCPKFGHKAARQYLKIARQLRQKHDEIYAQINTMLTGSRISAATRKQRQQYLADAITDWIASNPPPAVEA